LLCAAATLAVAMRRTQAVSSDVIEGRHQARIRAQHLERLRTAGPVVGSAPLASEGPPRFAHLEQATKAVPREARVRSRDIARNNALLVDSMSRILARRPAPNHDPVLLAKARKATVEDAYRPGPIPLPKSLNKDARTRQLEQLVLENERFLSRLITAPGVYRRSGWARQAEQEQEYLRLHCKFPYQNPSDIMPALNPMLAIANAQSNRAAEIVIRNQQAQLALLQQQQMQQQQQQQLLPPMPGATSMADTGNFGSTFGSTSASGFGGTLPPMSATSTASGNGIPNHFPLPQDLMPSPPSTAASMRPHQPLAPLSARSTGTFPGGSNGGVKLRAQYTSQGVRILRTGVRHHPSSGSQTARPATSASSPHAGAVATPNPLRLHMGSRNKEAKFQPLRTQQAQALQQQQERQQQQQQRQADEHKEEHPPATDAVVDSTVPAPESSGAASAAPAGPALLFEDTLVISGRPVLVRVSQRPPATPASAGASAAAAPSSSPSTAGASAPSGALDICVFDPYTSLEYALSLPLTFVRMCFYQVPDLLLEANKPFLVQTLLHYLVFATAGAGAGADGAPSAEQGFELLVDIVPPPPRNAAEAAAWARVQESAALEQAAWELANEKEAARARREAAAAAGATAGTSTTAPAADADADETIAEQEEAKEQEATEEDAAAADSSNDVDAASSGAAADEASGAPPVGDELAAVQEGVEELQVKDQS